MIDELWLLFWRRVTTGMFYAIMHAIGARLAVAMPRDLRIAPKRGRLVAGIARLSGIVVYVVI